MQRIMQSQALSDSSEQAYVLSKKVLEIKPRHPIIKVLRERVVKDRKNESKKQTASVVVESTHRE